MTMRVSNLMVLGAMVLALGACGVDDPPEPETVSEPSSDESVDEHIAIMDVWARVNPIPGRPAAVYLSATSPIDEELIGVSTPIAERAELHTHEHKDGMMQMIQVDSFAFSPGAPLKLQPGGDHLMLFGSDEGLAELTQFPITLTFREAGDIEVSVTVGEPEMQPDHSSHSSH